MLINEVSDLRKTLNTYILVHEVTKDEKRESLNQSSELLNNIIFPLHYLRIYSQLNNVTPNNSPSGISQKGLASMGSCLQL